jgi:hypothetical protein
LMWIYPIKMPFQAYDHIPHCPKASLGFSPPCYNNLYFPRKLFCLIGCLGVQSPNVSMKEGSLFVLFFSCLWDPLNRDASGMLQIVFLVSLERSKGGGVHQLGSMMVGLAVQKFLNIEWLFSLKIRINSKNPGFGRKNQLRMW